MRRIKVEKFADTAPVKCDVCGEMKIPYKYGSKGAICYDCAGVSINRVPVKVQKTVGRNAPCPCGSGKKYKYCCIKKSEL